MKLFGPSTDTRKQNRNADHYGRPHHEPASGHERVQRALSQSSLEAEVADLTSLLESGLRTSKAAPLLEFSLMASESRTLVGDTPMPLLYPKSRTSDGAMGASDTSLDDL